MSIVLAVHCFLAAAQFPNVPPPIRRDPNADTAAIVQVIVRARLAAKSEAPDGTYLVVADHTVRFCSEGDQNEACILPAFYESISWKNILPLVPEELKTRLMKENAKSIALPPLESANARVVPLHTIAEIFAGNGWWDEFYRRYPKSKGYLEVTKPVFTADNQNALIYVSHSCGGLCGTGWLMYLSREGGSWHIVDAYMMWIS